MRGLRVIVVGLAVATIALVAVSQYQLRQQVSELEQRTKDYQAIRENAMCAHAAAVAAGWGNHGAAPPAGKASGERTRQR